MDTHERQTVAGAYHQIDAHERVCAERYGNIRTSIADIKTLMKWGVGGLIAMAASLFGFMSHELYNNANSRLNRLESPPAAVAKVTP